MNNILILGGSGFIGYSLYKDLSPFFKTFGTYNSNINFKNVSLINLSAYEKFITDIDKKNINYKNDNDCKIELIDMLDYKYISNYNLSDKRFRIIRDNTAYIIWFTYLIH